MSYKSYSNYLGSNRCCNTNSSTKGAQGAQGAGGQIGSMGAMGSPGVTGALGPPGPGSSGSSPDGNKYSCSLIHVSKASPCHHHHYQFTHWLISAT